MFPRPARWARRGSAGLRPVDLRLLLAAQAFHRVGLAAEILPLLALRTDGVRGSDLLPFPAAQGGAEHARADDDTPLIGGCFTNGDVDAADTHRFLADFDDHLVVVTVVDDLVPRAATQHVGDVVKAPGPSVRARGRRRTRGHEGGQSSTSC